MCNHADYRAESATHTIRCADRDCDLELGVWEPGIDGPILIFNDDALESDLDVETCSWCTRVVLDSDLVDESGGARICLICLDDARDVNRISDLSLLA